MRLFLSFALACAAFTAFAQDSDVTFLERTGNKGSYCVFSVTTPVKPAEVVTVDGKAKLKPEEQACREVMNAILFKGVENYNHGIPLVSNTNDSFAKSIVNPKNKAFMTYFKDVQLENSLNNKQAYHYFVELNNFNLLRLLQMRGSIK